MSAVTKIEWAEATWNPITGCSHAGSPGCDMCYARRMARRLAGRCGYPAAPHHFDVTLRPERLERPLHWCKPQRIFVCSMSDLFHKDVPDEFIDAVFAIVALAPQHTFQLLTKRAERMARYFQNLGERSLDHHPALGYLSSERCICKMWDDYLTRTTKCRHICDLDRSIPLPNVWLGVSVENQAAADARREYLRQCPAAVKFVSYEPALGPVDWTGWEFVDQIISGGESGPGARPSHPDWHRATRDFCEEQEIAYFFKQWGAWFPRSQWENNPDLALPSDEDTARGGKGIFRFPDGEAVYHVGKKRAGRVLDGHEWSEYPSGGTK